MIKFLFFAAFFVVCLTIAAFTFWPWWLRNVRSKSWPTASGTITGGDIYAVGRTGNKAFRCTLSYSFQVNGESWAGRDTQDFYDEQTASDYAESRKGVSAEVRYNPRKPKSSVLL